MSAPTPSPEWWKNFDTVRPKWWRDLDTIDIVLKDMAGYVGVTATYSESGGLTIVATNKSLPFPLTIHCSAALCTPTVAATIIGRVGLGDFGMLEAVIGASDEVSIQRGPDGKPRFTASGSLSK